MPTAQDVVNKYLESQRNKNVSGTHAKITENATLEIVDVLPDGFTIKDVRTCVRDLLADSPETEGLTTNARSRIVTKTVNDAVNEGRLRIDEEGRYSHPDPTAGAASGAATVGHSATAPVAAPPPR